jgi:hypothetical protein
MDAGHDYVGSIRRMRRDAAWRHWASKALNQLRERTSRIRMTDQGCMMRAYSRRIVDAINQCREMNTFLPALAYTFSTNPTEVVVGHEERFAGESKYSLYSLVRLNFDLMTGFSVMPLQLFSMMGMLVAVLSMLQATLTLPGMAAIALTLGMAIDANVLINERVREELRAGVSPQAAIHAGYERAFATILDSNITTLIAGVALLAFGSGPVRGFAVVHCLGILTSMFSAVMFSRGLVNLWYGRQKKLKSVSIGQVWKPGTQASSTQPQV